MPGPIVVLGSANLDFVVRTPARPGPGETVFGSAFTTVPGGKGLNQAIAARRAGGAVCMCGAVGMDAWGEVLRDTLRADGVDVSTLATVPGDSGTAHITVQGSGENSIIVVPGANASVTTLSAPAAELIAGAAALVMQFELPQSVLLEAAAHARRHGVRTVLTPAPVLDPVPGLLDLIDIVVLNEHEVTRLSGLPDIEDATRALSGSRTVITTLGADGCLLAAHGEIVRRFAAPAVATVDSTGAGDTFVGVCVARLVAGDPLPRAIEWATVGAGISVTRAGATSSMPTWAEITAVGLT
ncbi:ribokinase [Leucobacter rhizosphaerae]|uniref:Ribokinase n=1 Tax=Leucobacter rhizosphaerae TaxID=2932245 RepID=A0ABY4FVH9_9MICO|nr:ribokinase [Leucobacter rhizosphaerae]UOQ60280.1 ribokinase [Leucobacter rhizosphaerae]